MSRARAKCGSKDGQNTYVGREPITTEGIESIWETLFTGIMDKKPTVRLTKLVESKWPKLYRRMYGTWGLVQQAAVTGLLDQSGVEVIDVEHDCGCAECIPCTKHENRPHDVDVLVKMAGHEVPIQVSAVDGALLHDRSKVVDEEYGAVNTELVNQFDTERTRYKIRKTPPGGITLLTTNSLVAPTDDWWYDGVDGKCIVLWRKDSCRIYHGSGCRLDAAKELCSTLGYEHAPPQNVNPRRSQSPKHGDGLPFCPRTANCLKAAVRGDAKIWTDNPDAVIGALYYPAYVGAYFEGLQRAGGAVQADGLASILRHVVERHGESVAEAACDKDAWRRSLLDALRALGEMVKSDNFKFGPSALVEICRILQDVASRRYDDYVCRTLSINEMDRGLHLRALFCLSYAVVYRLRERTPPDILETLTAAARLGGQDGLEHRIVLGCALFVGLRQAIPDWYAKNESLLFGKDSPDGMNTVLMRICLLDGRHNHTNTAHTIMDTQNMERYHALVLNALSDEIDDMRKNRPEGERRVEESSSPIRHFMRHVLNGSRGYGVGDSVRDLACIGPDAVSVAGHECRWFIMCKGIEKKFVDRAVLFWEAVLDSSSEPTALYGFGWGAFVKSIDRDTWERLMLRTCEAAGGRVEDPYWVIERASSDGNPTEDGARIVKLILRANKDLLNDLAVRPILGRMRENGVSIDVG